MAFSGGTYTLPAGNPVVTATTIQSSWANTTLSDIATALSTCMLKDGTQTITADIPMGGFKFTGLSSGAAAADSVRVDQLQNNTVSYLTGTAGTNTITASASPILTTLTAGQVFRFIPANTNTAATTLQINSTAATNIFWNNTALAGGEIRQNVPVEVFYDGTQYQLIGSAAMANTFAVPDTSFNLQAAGDRTKMFTIAVTGVATATKVTMFAPGTGGATIVGDTLAQTLTNKSFTAPTFDSPTINTLVTGSAIATQTVMASASSINTIVSPGRQHFHPGHPKAWGTVTFPTTVDASYPSAGVSVVNSTAGTFVITFGVTMTSANFVPIAMAVDNTKPVLSQIAARSSGSFTIKFNDVTAGATPTNPSAFVYSVFGILP